VDIHLREYARRWVSRLTTIGLVLVLIPVVMTAVVGWHWFDVATYQANWNTSATTDSHAVVKSILLCLWAFVGVESAAVSTGMVKNPKRTVPLATMLGTALAGIVYIAATQVIAGMYPASEMAASGAPFAISASTILGGWAAPMVSAFTAFACLTSLGSWMMLVGQAACAPLTTATSRKSTVNWIKTATRKRPAAGRGENDRPDGADHPDELHRRESLRPVRRADRYRGSADHAALLLLLR
jgi:cadaverine:lysine antiporter